MQNRARRSCLLSIGLNRCLAVPVGATWRESSAWWTGRSKFKAVLRVKRRVPGRASNSAFYESGDGVRRRDGTSASDVLPMLVVQNRVQCGLAHVSRSVPGGSRRLNPLPAVTPGAALRGPLCDRILAHARVQRSSGGDAVAIRSLLPWLWRFHTVPSVVPGATNRNWALGRGRLAVVQTRFVSVSGSKAPRCQVGSCPAGSTQSLRDWWRST